MFFLSVWIYLKAKFLCTHFTHTSKFEFIKLSMCADFIFFLCFDISPLWILAPYFLLGFSKNNKKVIWEQITRLSTYVQRNLLNPWSLTQCEWIILKRRSLQFASQALRSYHRKSKKILQGCFLALFVPKEYASRRWTIASLRPHLAFPTWFLRICRVLLIKGSLNHCFYLGSIMYHRNQPANRFVLFFYARRGRGTNKYWALSFLILKWSICSVLIWGKRSSLCSSQVAHHAGAYPGFGSIKGAVSRGFYCFGSILC